MKNKLGQTQSQINSAKQREQTALEQVAALNSRVSWPSRDASRLVRSRETAARKRLATDGRR